MKIRYFTEIELTYFTNFLKELAKGMEKTPNTQKRLLDLANLYTPPRAYVKLNRDQKEVTVSVLKTALISIEQGKVSQETSEQAKEHLNKVSEILSEMLAKLAIKEVLK